MLKISLLMVGTFIWGLGFVATRWTLDDYSPIWSNTLRFVFAGAISIPLLMRNFKELKDPSVLICAVILGIALQLQTIGIAYTSLAKSGFLTVFYAIFTPILSLIFLKTKFRKSYWMLVAMALLGIAMLCELEMNNFNIGDLFILLSAFVFSLHILAVDKYAQNKSAFNFNLAQCIYIGIVCSIFALIYEGPVSLVPLLPKDEFILQSSLSGFLILSIFSSIFAFYLQVYAQQGIAPHIVSLIFLMESIFAAMFGYLFFNELLSPLALSGCVLVLLSVALIPVLTNYKKTV